MTGTTEATAREGRRTALRRARRRRRRRLVAAAVAVLVALTVALTVQLASGGSVAPPPAPAPSRTQHTLLFQVQASNGDAVATALLADDPPARSGAVVLVPRQTIVQVPGSGTLPVSRALRQVSPESTRAAIADALGVYVDDGWVVDQPALAKLVDLLGGVSVDVDVPVQRAGVLYLQPGTQRLDGQHALVYLAYLAPGEQEQARLARVQQVLDALLGDLPATAPDTTPFLSQLGPRSISTLPVDRLAGFLVGLEQADTASSLQYDTLPVVPIDTGAAGGTSSSRVDVEATRAVVDRLLAGSVPPGSRDAGNRVLVLNGVGTPGLGEQVRAKLVPQGFTFVGSRNASRFGYARTQVLVPDDTAPSLAVGQRVAKALGLGTDAVRSTDQLGSVADVVVLVGADFRP